MARIGKDLGLDPDGVQCPYSDVLLFEVFRGGDLSHHLFLYGPFSMMTARAYFLQVGGALAHVHRHGRVHRDLKPWNIVLSDDFTQTKLIDFGLSTSITS